MSNFNYIISNRELNDLVFGRGVKIHFIGALGGGMLPLARLLVAMGCEVSGSDSNAMSDRARAIPFDVTSHSAKNVRGKDLVVYSLAIDEGNAELLEAARLGLPVVSRARLLGAIMLSYGVRVGVSGSHGKSTTVAILDSILKECGRDFTTVSGASLADGSDCRIGSMELMLYEACEYKDSFLHFSPTYQIITGVELDHTDYFESLDEIYSSFLKCARLAQKGIVVNGDSPTALRLADEEGVRAFTYGRGDDCYFRLCDVSKGTEERTASIICKGGDCVTFSTRLIGDYNLYNITAAASTAMLLGCDTDCISRAICSYNGIERRQSVIGTLGQRPVFYDYAHHPTEIAATIDAVKERYGSCTVVFRPHTYSRTKSLWDDFVSALCKATFTILLDIYPAREEAIAGVTSEALACEMGEGAVYLKNDEALDFLINNTRGAIIIMGAGEVDWLIEDIKSSKEFNK